MKKTLSAALLVLAVSALGSAHAALQDNGGGLIYDTDLDITWYDYNYMGPFEVGATWDQAVSWASSLTVGGVSGWRLPTSDFCSYENCTGSEMGHLYYTELGLTAGTAVSPENQTPFTALQPWENGYWSGVDYPADRTYAVYFNFLNGMQGLDDKSGDQWGVGKFALAVHAGNVGGPVPLAGDFSSPADCDVDGRDLAALIANPSLLNVATFAQNFGKNSCQ